VQGRWFDDWTRTIGEQAVVANLPREDDALARERSNRAVNCPHTYQGDLDGLPKKTSTRVSKDKCDSGGWGVAPQRRCCRNRRLAPSVAEVSVMVKVVLKVHKWVEFKVHWRAILV